MNYCMNKCLFVVILLLALTGCSNKQLYQAGQDYRKSECIRAAVSASQHQDCLKLERQSYEAYAAERKAINQK